MTIVRVRSHVITPETPAAIQPGARIRISIEDVSREDVSAPRVTVAEFPAGGAGPVLGPFEIEAELAPGRIYALRVHVDQNGSGEVEIGDLVSVARHSVPAPISASEAVFDSPAQHTIEVDVPVKVVGG